PAFRRAIAFLMLLCYVTTALLVHMPVAEAAGAATTMSAHCQDEMAQGSPHDRATTPYGHDHDSCKHNDCKCPCAHAVLSSVSLVARSAPRPSLVVPDSSSATLERPSPHFRPPI